MADYIDPGWRRALRNVGWFVVPFAHLSTRRKRQSQDGLTTLRTIFLALVESLYLFLIAFAFVAPWNSGHPGLTPLFVASIGAACLLAIVLLRRRPVVGDTPERLAANYRAAFFVGVGFAEAPAMFGACGTLIAQSLWIYLVGLPFALIGFASIAPSRGNIERRQQEIQALGSPLSLGQALMDETPPGRN